MFGAPASIVPKIIIRPGTRGSFTAAEFGTAIANNSIATRSYSALQKSGVDVSLYSRSDNFAGMVGNGQVTINLANNASLSDALSTMIHEAKHIRLEANTGNFYGLRGVRSGEYSARAFEFFFKTGRRPNTIERVRIQQEIIDLGY